MFTLISVLSVIETVGLLPASEECVNPLPSCDRRRPMTERYGIIDPFRERSLDVMRLRKLSPQHPDSYFCEVRRSPASDTHCCKQAVAAHQAPIPSRQG